MPNVLKVAIFVSLCIMHTHAIKVKSSGQAKRVPEIKYGAARMDINFINNSDRRLLFRAIDKDGNKRITLKEFGKLCQLLFRNETSSYPISDKILRKLFKIFDQNKSDNISKKEFKICYKKWIRKIIKPVSVLVIIDVQNDIVSGSIALKDCPAGQDGKEVVAPINKMLESVPFHFIFYVKDWHPLNHISFAVNAKFWNLKVKRSHTEILDAKGNRIKQRLWPTHCIMNSWGSELDPDLEIANNSMIIYKGNIPSKDFNSAFLSTDRTINTPLKMYLDQLGASDIYVCGIAYDVCVGETAIDSLNLGFRTILVDDASRGINIKDIKKTKKEVLSKGGVVATTDKVREMVLGLDRRLELGLHLANHLHTKTFSD